MKASTFDKYCLVVDEWFVNGFNGTQAYLKFYPKIEESTARVNFSKILTFTNIQDYIESKRVKTSNELGITLNKQLKRLDGMIDSKTVKEADKINAIKEQNKLLALYEEHNKQQNPVQKPPSIIFHD